MTEPIFESFGEIKKLTQPTMIITQKLHGSNAVVCIYQKEDGTTDLVCGSRTRWIYPGDDNYGFAAYVHTNKDAFLNLGVGRHYGEWCGAGINSGEGLTEKYFVLFSHPKRYEGVDLPPNTLLVPILYEGPISMVKVDECMADLLVNGSKLCFGFMRPEGVVVNLNGKLYKKVFAAEDSKWQRGDKVKTPRPDAGINYSHLCQPIRLEKLLSRDERYVREFPVNLPQIVGDYFADLIKEGQIVGSEGEIKAARKGASSFIFRFIKDVMENGAG